MSLYIVDASVGVKWFVPEVDSDAAQRLQNPVHQLHVPSLFDVEVANTIWKKLRRGELSSATANSIVAQLPSIPVARHADAPILKAAFELAEKTGRTVYDSLYLALAENLAGQLVTADDRFVNALSGTPWAPLMMALGQVP
ncbi:MAG TPA: type II toxin-antitoxin system VapC family toxin [Pirellulales bacterium]|nr:type II toxin-antitoxin system VapC family toxin [Pirellulales bacterium]